jgi:hypothetical protein
MRGCGPLGCGCGLFGLLIQLALVGVIALFLGSLLGVLPTPFDAPGKAVLSMVFDTFDQKLPAPVCETYPFLEEIFGRCG